MYDRIAPLYDFAESIFRRIVGRDIRAFLVDEFELRPRMRILEVSMGPGANLRFLSPDAEIHGLDLSMQMLRACRQISATPIAKPRSIRERPSACPFAITPSTLSSTSAASILSATAARALQEMLRVARPGSKLIVSDETEKSLPASTGVSPSSSDSSSNVPRSIASPVTLLPEGADQSSSVPSTAEESTASASVNPDFPQRKEVRAQRTSFTN